MFLSSITTQGVVPESSLVLVIGGGVEPPPIESKLSQRLRGSVPAMTQGVCPREFSA